MLVTYMLIGLVVNVITMLNKEVWEYWIEFGVFGFIIQLTVSSLLFPLVLIALSRELIERRG